MSEPDEASDYEIRLEGHVDERWRESLSGLTFTYRIDADGTPLTILRGPVLDEAELHGVLARIRDLGVPLLEVRRRPANEATDITQNALGGEEQ